MSWYDDLQARVAQAGNQALVSIDTYLLGSAVNTGVKVAESAQGGNLTPAQLALGQFGGAVAQAAPSATPSEIANAAQASQIIPAAKSKAPWIFAAGALAYFVFAKKSRRK